MRSAAAASSHVLRPHHRRRRRESSASRKSASRRPAPPSSCRRSSASRSARELLYFGDMIDAKTALSFGMVNRVVPVDELKAATIEVCRARPSQPRSSRVNRGIEAGGFQQRAAGRAGRVRTALRGTHGGRRRIRGDPQPRTGLKAALACARRSSEKNDADFLFRVIEPRAGDSASCSPPPCGRGWGWGVGDSISSDSTPPPSLSLPHKGGGNVAAPASQPR